MGRRGDSIVWPAKSQPYADAMPAPTLPPPNGTGLIFDATHSMRGFARYEQNNIANNLAVIDQDYGVCADPAGSGKLVAWCDSSGGKTNTNEFARSSMLTRRWIYPALRNDGWGNYATYASYYIDPVTTMSSSGDWCSIQGFHGPPFIGPSSTGLMVTYDPTTKLHYIRMGNVEGRVPKTTTVPVGQWFQVLTLFRYSTADEGGWADFYINRTQGVNTDWERIPIEGGFRKPFSLISDEEGNAWLTDKTRGPSYASWGCYGNRRAIIYCDEFRVGTTVKSVMPAEWNGSIAGVEPDKLWAPAPEPTPPTYVAAATNGKDGAMTNAKAITFTASSLSSPYHREAAHLSGSGPHPLVIHLHGDGYEEYTQYNSGTANSTASKYAKVAVDNKALFILPRTPDTSNQTWWSKASSTTWLVALIRDIKAKYNIDERRIFISGYSGGAEEVTYNLACDYHTLFKGGGTMLLGGGGAKGLTGFTGTPAANIKSDFLMRWWYGETDNGVLPSDTTIDAVSASAEGEAWYKTRGFNTGRTMIPGVNHYTSEPYGPDLLRQLIAESNTKYGV